MHLHIDIAEQKLYLADAGRVEHIFAISTAKNGLGERQHSECTPRGWHQVVEKIGANEPIDRIFKARMAANHQYNPQFEQLNQSKQISQDWILTRIVRIIGLEPGINQGVNAAGICCDSYARYIYLHGTPISNPMGIPLSHGCIRLHSADIMQLFELIDLQTTVFIN